MLIAFVFRIAIFVIKLLIVRPLGPSCSSLLCMGHGAWSMEQGTRRTTGTLPLRGCSFCWYLGSLIHRGQGEGDGRSVLVRARVWAPCAPPQGTKKERRWWPLDLELGWGPALPVVPHSREIAWISEKFKLKLPGSYIQEEARTEYFTQMFVS